MNGSGQNLYTVLGVPSTATQADINAAYKRKARELHPDVNSAHDAEERFKELVAAYETLGDEEKRARYDAFGRLRDKKQNHRTRGRRGPMGGATGFENFHFTQEDLHTPFDFFLRKERARQRRPRERELALSIPLEQAFTGTTASVVLPSGQKYRIRVPPGAKTGDQLKLREAHASVTLTIEPHPIFSVDGRDIRRSLKVAAWEAALGTAVEVETPVGSVRLKIPPGTSSGQVLRLSGQGLPQKPGRPGDAGNLYVEIKIILPKQSTEKERMLWEGLKQASDFDPRSS